MQIGRALTNMPITHPGPLLRSHALQSLRSRLWLVLAQGYAESALQERPQLPLASGCAAAMLCGWRLEKVVNQQARTVVLMRSPVATLACVTAVSEAFDPSDLGRIQTD